MVKIIIFDLDSTLAPIGMPVGEEELTLLKKIEEMESDDYIFPDRFNKKDYIITIAVAIVCLAGIILGAYLG